MTGKRGSRILDFLFGYEVSEKSFQNSRIAAAEKRFSDKIISGVGSAYTKHLTKSPLARFLGRITGAFAHTSLKVYGSILLSFGITTLLLNLANYYFDGFSQTPFSDLVIGTVFSIIAIPMLFIEQALCDFTERVGFLETLIYNTFCIKRASRRSGSSSGIPMALGVFLGAIPAAVGFFIPLHTLLLPILALMVTVLSLFSPEFSFMLTLLALPFLPLVPHPTMILISLIILTALSFFMKVLLGKRIYHFEQYDVLILLFSLFILISGIFNKGMSSFESSLVIVTLLLGYLLANNLIVNRRLADNAINIILFSSLPIAVYGIIDYFISPARSEQLDESFKESISARAASTFGNANVYAVFLIVVVIFSLTFALDKLRDTPARLYYFAVFIINATAIVLTWTRGAWLALILSVPAYLIIHFRRAPKILLIPAALIPIGLCFIPSAFIDRLFSIFNMADSSISVRLSIWRSSLLMLKDNLFIGVGAGEESFRDEISKYAEDAVTAPHSHNLFLEIACEAGIFALLLFAFMLLVRIRHIATYKPYIESSSLTSPITMTGIAVFALVAFGMTDYILYNSAMGFLFWVVFGIGSASLRISKNEHDEKLGYNLHTSMASAASTEVTVRD